MDEFYVATFFDLSGEDVFDKKAFIALTPEQKHARAAKLKDPKAYASNELQLKKDFVKSLRKMGRFLRKADKKYPEDVEEHPALKLVINLLKEYNEKITELKGKDPKAILSPGKYLSETVEKKKYSPADLWELYQNNIRNTEKIAYRENPRTELMKEYKKMYVSMMTAYNAWELAVHIKQTSGVKKQYGESFDPDEYYKSFYGASPAQASYDRARGYCM